MGWIAIMSNGEKIEGDHVIYSKIKDRLSELKCLQFSDYGITASMTYPKGVFGCRELIFAIGNEPLVGLPHLICGRIESIDMIGGVPQPSKAVGARIGMSGTNIEGVVERRTLTIYQNGAIMTEQKQIAMSSRNNNTENINEG